MQDHDLRLKGCRTESPRFRRMRCETCQDDEAMFVGPKCLKCGLMPAPKVRIPFIGREKYQRLRRKGWADKRSTDAIERTKFREMCGIKAPSK